MRRRRDPACFAHVNVCSRSRDCANKPASAAHDGSCACGSTASNYSGYADIRSRTDGYTGSARADIDVCACTDGHNNTAHASTFTDNRARGNADAGTAASEQVAPEPISIFAASASITVDGDTSDWDDITAASIRLTQIKPYPGSTFGPLDDVQVDMKVASDGERIFVLLEVPDDFDYNPENHKFSAALAVMFRIDQPAAPHMGTTEEKQEDSFGKVDIWHWELDCPPGSMPGGNTGIPRGNDPDCNLDDEWSTTPENREDDCTALAENSIAGVWDHTARSQGDGSDGVWIFEMSRKLQTGDPDDAQLNPGGTAAIALAYWDADETPDGWTDAGHVQSSTDGWINVTLP